MKKALLISLILHLILLPLAAHWFHLFSSYPIQNTVIELDLPVDSSPDFSPDKIGHSDSSLHPTSLGSPPSAIEHTPAPTDISKVSLTPSTLPATTNTSIPNSIPTPASILAPDGAASSSLRVVEPSSQDRGIGSKIVSHIKMPKVLKKVEIYPEPARRNRLQGTVVVSAEINESGKIISIAVLSTSGLAILDQAAIDSVRQWSFAPAKNSVTSEPVGCIIHIPFVFRLNKI